MTSISKACGCAVLIILGLTGVADHALAADVAVSYDVDFKTFKKGAEAGTIWRFELHEDAVCSLAVATDLVDVDLDLPVKEFIKTRKAKGGDVKPIKLVRVRHTFAGAAPTPGSNLWVTVVGIDDAEGILNLFPAAACKQVYGSFRASDPACSHLKGFYAGKDIESLYLCDNCSCEQEHGGNDIQARYRRPHHAPDVHDR